MQIKARICLNFLIVVILLDRLEQKVTKHKNSVEVNVAPALGKVTGVRNLDQWH